MTKEPINPETLPEPSGYNHGILVDSGDILFLAGQDAADPEENIVGPGDLLRQFEQVLANLQTVVESAGGEMSDIVKLNVFVSDRDEYVDNLGALGEIFIEYFGGHYPTMALFEVKAFFRSEALIEMEGFAVIDSS